MPLPLGIVGIKYLPLSVCASVHPALDSTGLAILVIFELESLIPSFGLNMTLSHSYTINMMINYTFFYPLK